jgi:hypothetical protein
MRSFGFEYPPKKSRLLSEEGQKNQGRESGLHSKEAGVREPRASPRGRDEYFRKRLDNINPSHAVFSRIELDELQARDSSLARREEPRSVYDRPQPQPPRLRSL